MSWITGLFVNKKEVQVNLDRIAFLMNYSQKLVGRDVNSVVECLKSDLHIIIPLGLSSLENHNLPDPCNKNLSISFEADKNTKNISIFVITGFNELANLLLVGASANGSYFSFNCVCQEQSRKTSPLCRAIQQEFWNIPGWRVLSTPFFNTLVKNIES